VFVTEVDSAVESRAAWLRFLLGILALALFFGFFASGYSPPGVFGEVLRHNQAEDIDASPLLYSEVEHMQELEEGVRELRAMAREQRESDTIQPGSDDTNITE
jgi:hypothetical protein